MIPGLSKEGVEEILILPVEANKRYQPEVKKYGSVRGRKIAALIEELSSEFGTRFSYSKKGLLVKT